MSVVLSVLAQCSALMLLILWIGATSTDPPPRVDMPIWDRLQYNTRRFFDAVSATFVSRKP